MTATDPSPWKKPADRKRERALKRDAVLRAAAQAFNENGFHKTSLDDVARSTHPRARFVMRLPTHRARSSLPRAAFKSICTRWVPRPALYVKNGGWICTPDFAGVGPTFTTAAP